MDLGERKGFSTRHPWEVARAAVFLRLLRERGLLENTGSWLDVGAGDAWFARQLRKRLPQSASITCWDINYATEDIEALRASESRNVTYVADRPVGRFDRILMLDVLEHVEEDAGFVAGMVRDVLSGDGHVLVSVPAYQSLYSSHDRTFRHFRRYSPDACRRLLERAGLDVLSSGGLFFSLLPVRLGRVLLDRLGHARPAAVGVGEWGASRTATTILTRILTTDGRLSLAVSKRGHSLPGLSFWALCRRESS